MIPLVTASEKGKAQRRSRRPVSTGGVGNVALRRSLLDLTFRLPNRGSPSPPDRGHRPWRVLGLFGFVQRFGGCWLLPQSRVA